MVVLRYFNFCTPSTANSEYGQMNESVLNQFKQGKREFFVSTSCGEIYHTQQTNPGINTNHLFSKSPIVIRCNYVVEDNPERPLTLQEDSYDIYLHVYGRLPFILVPFKDNITKTMMTNYILSPFKRSELIQQLGYVGMNGCSGILGTKVVYKRPPTNSAAGYQYMLKIYFIAPYYIRVNKIKQQLSEALNFPLNNKVYNAALSVFGTWLVTEDADPIGMLQINENIFRERFNKRDKYIIVNLYYKEIEFLSDNMFYVDNKSRANYCKNVIRFVKEANKVDTISNQIIDIMLTHKFHDAHGVDKWTRQCMKKIVMRRFYKLTLNEGYSPEDVSDIKIIMMNIGIKDASVEDFVLSILQLKYFLQTSLKQAWGNKVVKKFRTHEMSDKRMERTTLVSEGLRQLCFDIETSFIPRCRNEEQHITLIHSLLFTDKQYLKHVSFLYIAPDRSKIGLDRASIIDVCREQLGHKYADIAPKLDNFQIFKYATEMETIEAFMLYVQNQRIATISHFNGNSFDIPFLFRRLVKLGLTNDISPYYFPMSFTHRYDRGQIELKKTSKITDSARKVQGIQQYVEDRKLWLASELRQKIIDDDSDAGDDDDGDDVNDDDPRMNQFKEKTKNEDKVYMASILNITFEHVGNRDIMRTVGNYFRGCKLDTAARERLNIRKFNHPAVSYENLADTWKRGDLNIFVAYCALDVCLTVLLDQHNENNMAENAAATCFKLPSREMYGLKSLRRTMHLLWRFQWPRNIASADCTYNTGKAAECRFFRPDYEFDIERDFADLRPRAGRTITDVEGVYDRYFCILTDFNSQYPSIMIGNNICMSSYLNNEEVVGLREGIDYNTIHIPNVRPIVHHTCPKGANCTQEKMENMLTDGKCLSTKEIEKATREFGQKCKWETSYEIISYPAHFTSVEYFEGVSREAAKAMLKRRKMYKQIMADAIAKKDLNKARVANLWQLQAKLGGNGLYGVGSLIHPLSSGAVTESARNQNEIASEYLAKVSGPIVLSDTDSTGPIARDLCLTDGGERGLSVFAKKLGEISINPKDWKVSTLFRKLWERYEAITNVLNYGSSTRKAAWNEPAFLEVEKILINLIFISKKNYCAIKVLANGELETHIGGLACKRADRSRLKSISQLVALKLVLEGDFRGLALFMRDIHGLAAETLRTEEILQHKIKLICDKIDLDSDTQECDEAKMELQCFDEQTMRSELVGSNGLDLQACTSLEKVNSIHKPTSVASRAAVISCKKRGIPLDQCESLVEITRNSGVQVATNLLSIAKTVMIRPIEDIRERQRYERFEMHKRGFDSHAYEKLLRQRKKKNDQTLKSRNKPKALTITDMPNHLKAGQDLALLVSEKDRLNLSAISWQIEDIEKKMRKEYNSGFEKKLYTTPEWMNDKEEVSLAKARVNDYLENFSLKTFALPLWFYDVDFCETHLSASGKLPHSESCADLWEMYINDPLKGDYLTIIVGENAEISLGWSDSPLPDSMLFHSKLNYLTGSGCVPLDRKGTQFSLPMTHDYAQQTSVTPLIIAHPNPTKCRLLVNKGSYCPSTRNRFAFQVEFKKLFAKVMVHAWCAKYSVDSALVFRPIKNSTEIQVAFYTKGHLKSSTKWVVNRFIRDDGRNFERWNYDVGKWRAIHYKDIKLLNWIEACKIRVEEMEMEDINIIFNEHNDKVQVLPINCPDYMEYPFMLLDMPEITIEEETPVSIKKRKSNQKLTRPAKQVKLERYFKN